MPEKFDVTKVPEDLEPEEMETFRKLDHAKAMASYYGPRGKMTSPELQAVEDKLDLQREAGNLRQRHNSECPEAASILVDLAIEQGTVQTAMMPEVPCNMDGCNAHPTVDPMGCCTKEEMGFVERMQNVKLYREMADPMVRIYLDLAIANLEGTQPVGVPEHPSRKLTTDMHQEMDNLRALERAEVICPSRLGASMLRDRQEQQRSHPSIQAYESVLQGLETVCGISDKPMTPEVSALMGTVVHIPPLASVLPFAANHDPSPVTLNINYHNVQNQSLCKRAMDMETYNGKGFEEKFDEANLPEPSEDQISTFLSAAATQHLNAAFLKVDKDGMNMNAPNRASLITIEGKSVQSMIMDAAKKEGKTTPEQQQQFMQERGTELTSQFVSAGVLAGRRVEAFVPDRSGNLPQAPVAITQNGIDAASMKPVTLNRVQRVLNKMGFYKEKAAEADRYKAIMEGRKDVQETYAKQTGKEMTAAKADPKKDMQKDAKKQAAPAPRPRR